MTSPANTSDQETGTVERLVAEPHFDLVHLFERAVSRFEHDRDGYVTARRAILSELTRLKARADAAEARLDAVAAAIGSPRFMDPPDGGDVSLAEQVSRMWAALEASEAKLATAREALEQTQAFLERLIAMASGGADMSDANLALNMNAVLDLIHAAITEGADHERS